MTTLHVDLGIAVVGLINENLSEYEARKRFRTAYIRETAFRHGGNQCHMAKALGMHRNTLCGLLKELALVELVQTLKPIKRKRAAK